MIERITNGLVYGEIAPKWPSSLPGYYALGVLVLAIFVLLGWSYGKDNRDARDRRNDKGGK